jgi:hypothetical protein
MARNLPLRRVPEQGNGKHTQAMQENASRFLQRVVTFLGSRRSIRKPSAAGEVRGKAQSILRKPPSSESPRFVFKRHLGNPLRTRLLLLNRQGVTPGKPEQFRRGGPGTPVHRRTTSTKDLPGSANGSPNASGS